MNLGFPGGPVVEKMARSGDAGRFDFPRPLCNQKNSDMSFSGLKTAVRLKIAELGQLSQQDMCDIAAGFQCAVCDVIVKKTKYAITQYETMCDGRNIVVSGGVAANIQVRSELNTLADLLEYNFVAPPIKLCTDNAAMIAFAGLERFKMGIVDGMDFRPRARWGLEEMYN